ncbi:TIGR04104 family putative zinc finger protein [Oceanobacillus locisalsi]|uniref:TIGR04104 family putative zinc finger protein n=1 Tax=Oceanobacillus locisalsi TaxID=546107 RepID=A0ABW3NI51_9BACI
MKLPSCWNCAHSFTYRELVWNWRLRCPNCGNKQFLTKKSRIQILLIELPMYIIVIPLITIADISLYIKFPAVLILILMTLFILPFWYRFTNKEQSFV